MELKTISGQMIETVLVLLLRTISNSSKLIQLSMSLHIFCRSQNPTEMGKNSKLTLSNMNPLSTKFVEQNNPNHTDSVLIRCPISLFLIEGN